MFIITINNIEYKTNSVQKLVNQIRKGDIPEQYQVIY